MIWTIVVFILGQEMQNNCSSFIAKNAKIDEEIDLLQVEHFHGSRAAGCQADLCRGGQRLRRQGGVQQEVPAFR
jgi:hypothetical protein